MGGPDPASPPRVAGVVLAAGAGRRFGGGRPKQLVEIDGEPLVRRVCRVAAHSRLAEVVVVVGHEAARVRAALDGLEVRVVENPEWVAGQSGSVRRGLAAVGALDEAADGAMFLAADQPLLTAELIDRLAAAFETTGGPIVVPVAGGRRAGPVIFGRALFGELNRIEGDRGGRQLFERHASEIVEVEVEEARQLADVDTPEELAALLGRAPGTLA